MKLFRALLLAVLFINVLSAQKVPNYEKLFLNGLKKDISTLASDKFEGRETGTKGEQMAVDYIIRQFKSAGLAPLGTVGYVQRFTFTDGIKYDSTDNKMVLNTTDFRLGKDFFPLPYSSNGKTDGLVQDVGYGICAPLQGYDDYFDKPSLKGKIFIIETGFPGGTADSSRLRDCADLRTRIDTAVSRGAIGIIFINSDPASEDPKFLHRELIKIAPSSIPVVFAKGAAAILLKLKRIKNASLETMLTKEERTGQNVIGFIDNNAPTTIIIGAHLDHLGLGDPESSLYKGGPAIHNGADDNASGTAAVIALARFLKTSGLVQNNYLFICFSGEEKGLLGSSYYSRNPTIDLSKVNYMINMDMIGRLKRGDRTLAIYGTGTAPLWMKILPAILVDSIQIKTIDAGVGPSDHTSFYLKDIPVLHFFSGFHPDYHKPTDDAEKINYEGEVSIIEFIIQVITLTNDKGKIEFTKTKDEPVSSKNTTKPKVSLGVIPDYIYSSGNGLRIDGVSEGKPAMKAGLKASDIIIQIGDSKIVDMPSYMKALDHFNKGDSTKVKVRRGDEIIEFEVTF
jgi:aminopeptidase YwaD